MPAIPEQTIEEIRDRADIVEVIGGYIPVKKRGSDYWAQCPFHHEKTPSFKISPTRQAFYCFGCHKSGNVFHFVQSQENVDFVGAVRLLARRFGIIIPEAPPRRQPGNSDAPPESRTPKEALLEVLDRVCGWYQQQLKEGQGAVARDYLESRGIAPETIATFRLGYSPDSWDQTIEWGKRHGHDLNLLLAAGLVITKEDVQPHRHYDRFRGRLMFPIWDELGRIVGFSARTLDSEAKTAKYVNSPETAVFHKSKLLYGLHFARKAFEEAGGALVCEGQLDVIACHRAGITHAVAPQGTAFTEDHARMLGRFTNHITFAFDADKAGEQAAVRSLEVAHAAGLTGSVVVFPEGQDPDGVFRSSGADALRAIVQESRDAFPFILELAERRYDRTAAQGKSQIAHEALASIAALPDPMIRATTCQWLSQQLSLPEKAVFEALNPLLTARRRQQGRSARDYEGPVRPETAAPLSRLASPIGDKATVVLLDLALHHGFIAHELVHRLPQDLLGQSPTAMALNLVIAHTQQGEWADAAADITTDQELAAEPEIARILVDSAFKKWNPEHAEDGERQAMEERLRQAMDDCLRQLELADIDRRRQQNQQALAAETDSAKIRDLLQIRMELDLRAQQLKNKRMNPQEDPKQQNSQEPDANLPTSPAIEERSVPFDAAREPGGWA